MDTHTNHQLARDPDRPYPEKPSLPTIKIERLHHRESVQIALRFPYHEGLKDHLKVLDGMKWSRTHRCFYISNDWNQLWKLVRYCKGIAELDMSALKEKKEPPAPQPKKEVRKEIKAETKFKIEEVRRWMEQQRYRTNTVRTYVSFIYQFFHHHPQLDWDKLNQEIIVRYNHQHFIEGKRSFSSQNQWINAIKIYLRVHHLDIGELEDVERPKISRLLPNVLTKEEVKSIILATGNIKHKFLLSLTYGGGLRIGEVLGLELVDVRVGENLLYIRSSKGAKDRRVPLSDRMISMYKEYLMAYKPKKYVIEGQYGGQYSQSSAQKVLKNACEKAGMDIRVTLHTLRHSYATHLMESGVGLRYIQEILGHQSPKTTMIYTHVSGRRLSEVKSPLDDLGI